MNPRILSQARQMQVDSLNAEHANWLNANPGLAEELYGKPTKVNLGYIETVLGELTKADQQELYHYMHDTLGLRIYK